MRRNAGSILGIAMCAAALTGCVDRRFVVTTEPPGAVVEVNGREIGATPVDDHFIYYGKYHLTIKKDGFQTLQVDQDIPAPWYEYFPLDFISENLWPERLVDVHRFNYQLQPMQQPQTDEMLRQAENLRNRGRSLQPPASAGPP